VSGENPAPGTDEGLGPQLGVFWHKARLRAC